jgi:plasmid stability protein
MWAVGRIIQLRNVPEELHRKLRARAAAAGMSLSDYLLREVRRSVERPTNEELLERLRKAAPVMTRVSPAAAVRAERGRRDRR